MSFDGFYEYVLDVLSSVGTFRSRKMFGGYGIYKGDVFFAIIADDILYFKVDDTNRVDYEEHGCKPFTYMGKSKPISLSYWEVPVDVLEDRQQLEMWIKKACQAACNAKATKAKPKKSNTKK